MTTKKTFSCKIKRIFGIFLILPIFAVHNTYGQSVEKVKILNNPYYTVFFKSLINSGGPIKIEEYIHPEIYDKAMQAFEDKDYDAYRGYAEKATETRVVQLKAGTYHLQNKERTFDFKVNENGIIEGKSKLDVLTVPTAYKGMTIVFDSKADGKLSLVLAKRGFQILSEISYTNELSTNKLYDDNGKIAEVRINKIPQNKSESEEELSETSYFTNGNIKARKDFQNKISEYFYENGKKKEYKTDNPYELTQYDEQGRIIGHSFDDEKNNRCEDILENGVLVERTCENNRIGSIPYKKVEIYQRGKLMKYTVTENGKEKNYNAAGKLLNEKDYPESPPPTMLKN